MTDIVETTEETTEVTEEVTEAPPFLRITSTRPADAGRFETITLELNLRDDEPVGELAPAEGVAGAQSWLLALVATTLREMLRAGGHTYQFQFRDPDDGSPDGVLLDHPGRDVAADCTDPLDDPILGHAGSDRWTGGDRKDAK